VALLEEAIRRCLQESDAFRVNVAVRLAQRWIRLLEAAAAEPARRISTLDILAQDEHRTVLTEWAGSAVAAPAARSVAEAFAVRAARDPDAVAVRWAGGVLSQECLDYVEATWTDMRPRSQAERVQTPST
jgi:non-ribosomal peptide synthetase component F